LFSMDAVDVGCRFTTTYEWDGELLYIQDPDVEKIHYEGTLDNKGRLYFMYSETQVGKRYMLLKKVE
ncbi:MAG: hypothetical protein Q4D14_08080, partial [Bacteroidales bacterium]|nr:hypothetical protein [Bacteroidales bacterium]